MNIDTSTDGEVFEITRNKGELRLLLSGLGWFTSETDYTDNSPEHQTDLDKAEEMIKQIEKELLTDYQNQNETKA